MCSIDQLADLRAVQARVEVAAIAGTGAGYPRGDLRE